MSHHGARFNSLGVSQERKRAPSSNYYSPAARTSSSASAFTMHPNRYSSLPSVSNAGTILGGHLRRSPSPPASAYLDDRLRPTPDADSHFAYSTTLRRHSEGASLTSPEDLVQEASSLWSRLLKTITGDPQATSAEQDLENDAQSRLEQLKHEDRKNTASAKFAHTSIEDTIAYFRTSSTTGILISDIPHLQAQHGYNEFSVSAPEPALIKFAKTIYESPLILLLCGSATISAIMGNIDDAVSITVAVLIVLTVGFVQERRSEKSLEALNKLVPHHCHVIRSSQTYHILANELVPGDLVSFTTGDRIPADIRIISAVDLEIDESSLTGETEARHKDAETCAFESRQGNGYGIGNGMMNGQAVIAEEAVGLADRSCIAYMGTLVRNGRGTGIVVATGSQTEFGVIFSMMQEIEEKRTPLQLNMDELAKKLSILSFGIIGVICLIGVLQQRSWLDMFTIGVSLAVAAIPEGLPIVTTVTLALGVLRMAKRKAIVKKLHSVESLGSVSVICSDKTGTLTKNEQTVTEGYVVDETLNFDPTSSRFVREMTIATKKLVDIGVLCNNATVSSGTGLEDVDGTPTVVGQSTDVALINLLGVVGGLDKRISFKRLSERPFNSEQKYMAVSGVHLEAGPTALNGANSGTSTPVINAREMLYMKGSLEAVLEKCKFYYVSDESTPGLDMATRESIVGKAQAMQSRGLRVIAMAYGYGSIDILSSPSSRTASREGSPAPLSMSDGKNLIFVGFQAMYDPPRKGVADSISLLQSGGVKVVMITGDAEPTALSIARKLGMNVGGPIRNDSLGGIGRHGRTGTGSIGSRGELSMSLSAFPAPGSNPAVLTGKAIDQMTDAQLQERVGSVSVFARTTPRHKIAIVKAFQRRGEVVAMTGDGVNDAPALKKADIGLSMGKSGTDVAKEAADVILVDDNFSTMLFAVEEGKSIFHNIQNFLAFQLSTAAAALTLITLSTMLGLSNPLNAMQILFINILMDGPPSQSLGVDPVDPSIMKKPPRKKNASIITQRLLYRVLFSASMIVIGTLFVYVYALDEGMSKREQTMTFSSFVFLDLVSAIQNRGINCNITANRMLLTTVSISAITQLALVYVPIMQRIFQTDALGLRDFSVLLLQVRVLRYMKEGGDMRGSYWRKRAGELLGYRREFRCT
ncbi:Ca-transporting ATPase [Dendrothele bispora CBS 962.96]|uniref:Calcium-transporting ATPase 1 n=1 Tax=Dendrothele bispora (strain CBS 962.96) TaxID=1314807 RepID=A0A4S8MW09_DENBC|nr:Ca-transporting ATPase [Dendrothele bispora CBS 962.96]